MVVEQEHITGSRTSTGERQCNSRQGVLPPEGSVGLEIEPTGLQPNSTHIRSLGNRPVCITNDHSAALLFQLETRSLCRGNGCLPTSLEGKELYQPSLGTHPKSAIHNQKAGDQCHPCSTRMESPSMVSSPIISSDGLPSTDPGSASNNRSSTHSATSNQGSGHTTGGMAHIRESLQHRDLSKDATDLFMASWKTKSQSNYNSLLHKWERWCEERGRNPILGPVDDIANFLVELYQSGYAYRSLNSYRSAISAIHGKVDGYPIGQHPLITRVLKGAFNNRPPQPRYKSMWKVSQVIDWLDRQNTSDIQLLMLTMKTVTLCALTRPCRSSDLANFSSSSLKDSPEGVTVAPLTPPKQSQPGKTIKEYFFPYFIDNKNVCPASTLLAYVRRTEQCRQKNQNDALFLISTKPFSPATSATIARWIKTFLSKAGIDTSIFKAHSIRGASTSAAADAGISIPEILEAADWSNMSTFEKFYHRPNKKTQFGTSVLKSASNLQS